MNIQRGLGPLGLAASLGVAGFFYCNAGTRAWATATPEAAESLHLAVVDYTSLIKNHPDYTKLKQLDEQLSVLEQEKLFLPLSDQKAARDEAFGQMDREVEKGKAELEAERVQIEAELSGMSRSLAAQMEGEMQRLHSHYKDRIAADVAKIRPPEAALTDSGNQSVREYLSNLQLIRERNLAARRIELERSIRAEVEAERQRLDADGAAYEDQVATQYQEEKLNIQLKLQVTTDEAEQSKLQDRLDAIASEISQKKATHREVLDADFQKFRGERQARFEKEMGDFQRKLDLEVQSKLAAKRQELGGNPQTSVPAPPEIQTKIQQIEAGLRSEMQAKEAALRSQMAGKAAEAKARLEAKQDEVRERLRKKEEEIKTLFEARIKNVSKKTQDKLDAVEKNIEQVKAERKSLYQQIAADLNRVVGEVAAKKHVPMVIGQVVYNRTCEDLTDLSMVAVKQMESR